MIARVLVLFVLLAATSQAKAEERRVHLHTREVEALLVDGEALWVGTTGGIERYDLRTLERTHHLTTEHGLDAPSVRRLRRVGASVVARTDRSECLVREQEVRCSPAAFLGPPRLDLRGELEGAPITASLRIEARTFVGTRGRGLWVREEGQPPRRLTPEGQICTHHVRAAAIHRGEVWFGGFRDGLCVRRGERFVPIVAPFRFVNAMASHGRSLYVAANEGLFVTRDASTFVRVRAISERGINGLAVDGRTLWASSPTVVYALPLGEGKLRRWVRPGGSTSVQAVAARNGTAWLATEDRGAVRVTPDSVEVFDVLRGLGSSWALDVAVDEEGDAYVATLRNGVHRIRSTGEVEALPSSPRWGLRVYAQRGEVTVGSQSGLWIRRDDGSEHRDTDLPHLSVHVWLASGEVTFLGTEHGLVELRSAHDPSPSTSAGASLVSVRAVRAP